MFACPRPVYSSFESELGVSRICLSKPRLLQHWISYVSKQSAGKLQLLCAYVWRACAFATVTQQPGGAGTPPGVV